MNKKLKVLLELEIDNPKEFRRAWKSEGYNNPEDFLNDYLSADEIGQDLMQFDFEITKINIKKCKVEKENEK